MNSPRGDVLLAVLLVIAGHLGVIARALTGAPFFGLMGLASFVLAVAVLVGMLVRQFRVGLNEPSAPRRRRSAEYVGEDGKPIPADRPKPQRSPVDYRSLD